MISVISAIAAVVGIWFARRSATASEVSALQAKTATEVAQKQLAIERDRRRDELAQRHEADGPVLEGHVVRRDEDDGAGQARLEIRVTNSVQLTLVSLTRPAQSPVSLHGREPMMAQDSQYPESGNGRIEVGRPAWWNVDLTGRQRPFEILVIAHADYGKKWDRSVKVVFDD